MTNDHALELFLLDNPKATEVLALGRCGSDIAIETLPINVSFQSLSAFRTRIEDAVLGRATRPTAKELRTFGEDLFIWLFHGSLRGLYNQLPNGQISLQILSNRAELKAMPWEYLNPPDRQPAPHRDRCIVRVLSTCGVREPPAKSIRSKIRVLFVVADPIDQAGVSWDDVQTVIERTIKAQLPGGVELKVVEGASRQALAKVVAQEEFDIFHFFGHGEVRKGEGHLVLVDLKTQKSDYLAATQLATLLAGKGVRLALLSACLTAAGQHQDDFSLIAGAL